MPSLRYAHATLCPLSSPPRLSSVTLAFSIYVFFVPVCGYALENAPSHLFLPSSACLPFPQPSTRHRLTYPDQWRELLPPLARAAAGRATGIAPSAHAVFLSRRIESVTLTSHAMLAHSRTKASGLQSATHYPSPQFSAPLHAPQRASVSDTTRALVAVVETMVRMADTLSERLHLSFYFYFMLGPATFVSLADYAFPLALLLLSLALSSVHIAVGEERTAPRQEENTSQEALASLDDNTSSDKTNDQVGENMRQGSVHAPDGDAQPWHPARPKHAHQSVPDREHAHAPAGTHPAQIAAGVYVTCAGLYALLLACAVQSAAKFSSLLVILELAFVVIIMLWPGKQRSSGVSHRLTEDSPAHPKLDNRVCGAVVFVTALALCAECARNTALACFLLWLSLAATLLTTLPKHLRCSLPVKAVFLALSPITPLCLLLALFGVSPLSLSTATLAIPLTQQHSLLQTLVLVYKPCWACLCLLVH
jgi:hypothetical protein